MDGSGEGSGDGAVVGTLVGAGVGAVVGCTLRVGTELGRAVGIAESVGESVGIIDGTGVGSGVGVGAGVGVRVGAGVTVGVGVGSADGANGAPATKRVSSSTFCAVRFFRKYALAIVAFVHPTVSSHSATRRVSSSTAFSIACSSSSTSWLGPTKSGAVSSTMNVTTTSLEPPPHTQHMAFELKSSSS